MDARKPIKLSAEDIALINIVNWFDYTYPEFSEDFLHIANERRCSIQQGRILKRKGVKAGVADIHVAIPNAGYHGLWIELKVNNGKLTKAQKRFLARKVLRGYCALALWGEEAVKETIKAYLGDCR